MKSFPARDTWVSEQGDLYVARPTPRVTLVVHRGHLEVGFGPPIRRALERSIVPGHAKPYLFVDAELLETYDPRLRRAAVDWLSAHAGDFAAVHVLARSPLARMAITLTSPTLGGVLIGHQERASFDAALCEAISTTLDGGGVEEVSPPGAQAVLACER